MFWWFLLALLTTGGCSKIRSKVSVMGTAVGSVLVDLRFRIRDLVSSRHVYLWLKRDFLISFEF